jgi:hypothetical protein
MMLKGRPSTTMSRVFESSPNHSTHPFQHEGGSEAPRSVFRVAIARTLAHVNALSFQYVR